MQNSLLRHIVRAIYGVYYRIYIRTSGNTFCWLFNMQARVINAPVRMQYDSATKLYLAKGDGRALHFKRITPINTASGSAPIPSPATISLTGLISVQVTLS